MLPPDSKTSDADVFQKVDGTFIVVRGESVEDVWEKLKKDVFYTSGEVVSISALTYPLHIRY